MSRAAVSLGLTLGTLAAAANVSPSTSAAQVATAVAGHHTAAKQNAPSGGLQGDSRGAIRLVSTKDDGTQIQNGLLGVPALSPDGTGVAFTYEAPDLVKGDSNSAADVFYKDFRSGHVTRVSVDADGSQGRLDGESGGQVWSEDGSRIAFWTHTLFPSERVPYETARTARLLIKSLSDGTLFDVTSNIYASVLNPETVVAEQELSSDWSTVAFTSSAANFIQGGSRRSSILTKDLQSGQISLVSSNERGTSANASSGALLWSPDGSRIAFSSKASNLVPGDRNKAEDVFVKNLATGEITRAIKRSKRGELYVHSWSPDGKYLAFATWASGFATEDKNGRRDVFILNLRTGKTRLVSANGQGKAGNWDSRGAAWSPDSRRIAFTSSASNLVKRKPRNNLGDIYVKDLKTGSIQRISTNANGRPGNDLSEAPEWSRDGKKIAFTSRASDLVPNDMNDVDDVFVKTLR